MADLNITEKERNLLVKLAIIVAVSYGAVWVGERFATQYSAEVRSANSELKGELDEYRSKLAEIEDEEVLQSQYVETYNDYKERNLIVGSTATGEDEVAAEIDEANKLLERLQQITRERKFFEITYSLPAAENLPASFSELTADSDVAIRARKMNLEMPLLHSLDLLMLLNDFYDVTDNRFTPSKCTMEYAGKKADQEDGLLQLDENIQSECDLVWLSVHDPKQGIGEQEEGTDDGTSST